MKVRYGGKGEGGTRLWRWDMEGRDGLGNAIFFQWDFVGKRCYIAKQGNLRKQTTTTIQVKVEVKWYDKKEKNDLQLNLVAARWWIRNEAFWQTEVSWRHEYSLYSVEKMTERKKGRENDGPTQLIESEMDMACRYNHFPQTSRIALCFKRMQSDKNKQTNKIQRINTESGHSIIKGKHSKIRVPFFFLTQRPRLD